MILARGAAGGLPVGWARCRCVRAGRGTAAARRPGGAAVGGGAAAGVGASRALARGAPAGVDRRAPAGVRGQRSRPSSTPSPSSSPGQPRASTVAPRGVSEQRSRPSGIASPSLSLGAAARIHQHAGLRCPGSGPDRRRCCRRRSRWVQPLASTEAPGGVVRAAVDAVGHAVAVAVGGAAAAVHLGARRRVGAAVAVVRGCRPRRCRRSACCPASAEAQVEAEVGEWLSSSCSLVPVEQSFAADHERRADRRPGRRHRARAHRFRRRDRAGRLFGAGAVAAVLGRRRRQP